MLTEDDRLDKAVPIVDAIEQGDLLQLLSLDKQATVYITEDREDAISLALLGELAIDRPSSGWTLPEQRELAKRPSLLEVRRLRRGGLLCLPLTPTAPRTSKPTPKVVRASDLVEQRFPDVKWIVPGIFPEGVTIMAGRPKTGKSWLALDVALAVAGGTEVLGSTVVQGSVLYLSLEDSVRRLQSRIRSVLNGAECPPDLEIATHWSSLEDGGLEAIEEWLDSHSGNARLVVIDTLQRVKPRDRAGVSAYGQDYSALTPLADLAHDRNVAIVVVHHTRKMASADYVDQVSGTLGLAGVSDTIIVLVRGRGENQGILFVTGRDVDEREVMLRWDFPHWVARGEAIGSSSRSSPERNEITELLSTKGPLTPKQVAESLDKNYSTTKVLLWKMNQQGELQAKDGRYSCNPVNPIDRVNQTPPTPAPDRVRSELLPSFSATAEEPPSQTESGTGCRFSGFTQLPRLDPSSQELDLVYDDSDDFEYEYDLGEYRDGDLIDGNHCGSS